MRTNHTSCGARLALMWSSPAAASIRSTQYWGQSSRFSSSRSSRFMGLGAPIRTQAS